MGPTPEVVRRNFFVAFGLFGSKLLSNTIFGLKIMINRLWVCETHARIRVYLIPRSAGLKVVLQSLEVIETYEECLDLNIVKIVCVPENNSLCICIRPRMLQINSSIIYCNKGV